MLEGTEQRSERFCKCEDNNINNTLTGPWPPAKAALVVRNYLEVYWPCASGLSAMNAFGTQLRDPINSGLTRWPIMAVLN